MPRWLFETALANRLMTLVLFVVFAAIGLRAPQRSLMELRSILDWQIAPRLKEVPGVGEVNSYGGELKTFEVQIKPGALTAYGIGLEDVFHALERNNSSSGGGYLLRNGE